MKFNVLWKSGVVVTTVAGVMISGSMEAAQGPIPEEESNGVDWGTTYYDPDENPDSLRYDKLPTDDFTKTFPQWKTAIRGGEVIIQENYLRIVTNGPEALAYRIDYNPAQASEVTIETRLRIVALGDGALTAGSLVIGLGEMWTELPVSPNQFGPATNVDLTDWTTVRITISGIGGEEPVLQIYVDGESEVAGEVTGFNPGGSALLTFGDPSPTGSGRSGTVDWDYIRWTDKGAFPPTE